MKTNFDVWRDQLTPEKLIAKYPSGVGLFCEVCPAHGEKGCKAKTGYNPCNAADFLRWANVPAKEEE